MLTQADFSNSATGQVVVQNDIVSYGLYNSKRFVSTKHRRVIIKPRICSFIFVIDRKLIKPEMLGRNSNGIKLTLGVRHCISVDVTLPGMKGPVDVKAGSILEVIKSPMDTDFIEIAVFEDS